MQIVRPPLMEALMTENKDKAMTPLHVAAYNCDLDVVRELLESGTHPDVCDKNGFTPLHWCAFRGLVGTQQHLIAEALLEAGADANACTTPGDCVLNFAIESGNQKLVEVLLSKGADVNIVANDVTPLMTAARVGDKDIIEMLLQVGVNPNAEVGGFNAYDYADHYGHGEILLLLKPGD